MADTTTVMDRTVSINFSDPSIYHDRVFVVEGEKFHVLSQTLSMWSEHFRRMFEGDFAEANKKENEIKEVEPELFKKYLLVIYKNTCELKADELVPLIHLSYRFLTSHVMNFCKKYIDENLEKLADFIKLELLKTVCLYHNKNMKKKLSDHFQNDQVMKDFKCGDVVDIVVEYHLDDLKAYLGDNMSKNLTFANCIDLLDSSVKFNMPTLKECISRQIGTWYTDYHNYPSRCIPRELIIDLTKAAFEHNVQTLKDKLRYCIKNLCNSSVRDKKGGYYQHFLLENYDHIMKFREDVKKFIFLAAAGALK